MNVLLLALQASLCFLAQASFIEVPIQNSVPIDFLKQFIPKIVGGQNAIQNEFPFMVHLQTSYGPGKSFLCGASIINADFVLTAGHCVFHPQYGWANPSNVMMYVGTHSSDFNSQHAQVVQGYQIAHLGYDSTNHHQNDIAIVRVAQKIQMIPGIVQPICIASGTSTYADRYGMVIGWGVNAYRYFPNSNNGVAATHPQYLQKAQMYMLNPSTCAQLASPDDATPGKLCVYDAQNSKIGVCSGDSGGPLVVAENGRYVQVGVASYITGPCGTQKPSVYTRLTNYQSLFQQVVGSGNYLTC